MAKRKIIILGGGIAGLSAAYHLTRTQVLRDQYDLTVYQLGWRLGGKGASGRDVSGRNLEHGLHVWFGMYENTFRMFRELYDGRASDAQHALQSWRDAVKPQNFTPIGVCDAAGSWCYVPLTWPTNEQVPGEGGLLPTLSAMIETILGWIVLFLSGRDQLAEEQVTELGPLPVGLATNPRASTALNAARAHLRAADANVTASAAECLEKAAALIRWAHDAHALTLTAGAAPRGAHALTHEALNLLWAVVKGVAEDVLVPDAPLIALDDLDLRAWLLKHGADPKVVGSSSLVRMAYDTMFQYVDGDAGRPNLAAGTGLGTILRLAATYKGAVMWAVQAGMGEVMFGPLYDHLVACGVQFKFFHKVTDLEPQTSGENDSQPRIKTVRIDVQAKPVQGGYDPVLRRDGLTLWPAAPDWSQLQDGAAMQAAHVNFESHWCQWPAAEQLVLEHGQDFDAIVLAIALGALKPLNAQDRSPCESLMQCNPAFARWLTQTEIVPSLGVQLWSNRSTAELGWTREKPAAVSGPEYLDIWADMSQVLAFESGPLPKARSLHYLTGTFPTTLYRQPSSAVDTPALGAQQLRNTTIEWLNNWSALMWPAARHGEKFDWNVLNAPDGLTGDGRLNAQFLRLNIDPTECTTLSGAGSTRFRLHAHESGFTNLILAGEGTAMGLPTSFEGAVMSGAAAARVICGDPEVIVGYDFLERRPSQWENS